MKQLTEAGREIWEMLTLENLPAVQQHKTMEETP